jgi:hypothetical protein
VAGAGQQGRGREDLAGLAPVQEPVAQGTSQAGVGLQAEGERDLAVGDPRRGAQDQSDLGADPAVQQPQLIEAVGEPSQANLLGPLVGPLLAPLSRQGR